MNRESQRRGFKQKSKFIMMLALLFAACALLTQCTAGDRDADVSGMNASASPEVTAAPTPTPEPTPTPVPTPVPTPRPSDWYIDGNRNIPFEVEMICPPSSHTGQSSCVALNEDGKPVCQVWEWETLKREWELPEEILNYGEYKKVGVYWYDDEKTGDSLFYCHLYIDYDEWTNESLGPMGVSGVFYMRRNDKDMLIVYNSYTSAVGAMGFTTPDGMLYRFQVHNAYPIDVYCWQMGEGIYLDWCAEKDNYMVFDKDGVVIGLPKVEDVDPVDEHIIFAEPFDKPLIAEWDDVEE